MNYKLFQLQKKVDLKKLTGEEVLNLQDVIRFSPGTQYMKEELHYEDSPESTVKAYEILIPINGTIVVRISPEKASNGTTNWNDFQEVIVQRGQGIAIYPRVCHWVREAGEFMVLKMRGGWKFSRNVATPEGECCYQEKCKTKEMCPNPLA